MPSTLRAQSVKCRRQGLCLLSPSSGMCPEKGALIGSYSERITQDIQPISVQAEKEGNRASRGLMDLETIEALSS